MVMPDSGGGVASTASVAGLRVFLTGASSGLGHAFAHHYARQGAHIGLVARRAEVLQALCDELPGEHLALVADVGDRYQMQAAADRYIACFGVPDIVIANAGVSTGTLTEIVEDLDAFETVLRTNYARHSGYFSTVCERDAHTYIRAPGRSHFSGWRAGVARRWRLQFVQGCGYCLP